MKLAEKILSLFNEQQTASQSDKAKFAGMNKKIDAYEAELAKLLQAQVSTDDDAKKKVIMDKREQLKDKRDKLKIAKKAMQNKFRGLRS